MARRSGGAAQAAAAAPSSGEDAPTQNGIRVPRLVVFDLDNCCWDPEMYQLYSGAPFTYNAKENSCACSGRGRRGSAETVRLLGDVAEIWGLLRNKARLPLSAYIGEKAAGRFGDVVFDPEQTRICIASCCDEPSWARELLGKFRVVELQADEGGEPVKAYGETMAEAVTFAQIHYGNKKEHHREIQKASGGVDFRDMFFFDDQGGHIRDVGGMGVIAVHTPHGGVKWGSFMEAMTKLQQS